MYRILGEALAGDCDNYRGACRDEPEFVETVSEQARINILWSWYVTELADKGHVVDLQEALELVSEYRKFNMNFEVIRLSFVEDMPRPNEEFLGVDVVDKTLYSLGSVISSGIAYCSGVANTLNEFNSKLNSNVLFPTWSDAATFTRIVHQLQRKGQFDPDAVYTPVCLFRHLADRLP